jgi:hypothetical protein
VLGNGPHKGTQCPGQGDHALLGIVACGHQGALPWAAPDLGLPAAGLERCGELCQAPLEMPTDCGRIPGGPGPCDQGTPGMGMARLGHTALLTPRPTGICRGRAAKIMPELSGVLEARQVAQVGPRRHRPSARDTAPGLEGLDDRLAAPGVPLLVECKCQTAQTFRLCSDGRAGFLKDQWRRWGWTAHLAAPAEVGRAPVGSPCLADIRA